MAREKSVAVEANEPVNCLRKARIEVRFVPKANSRIMDPKHVMYGDMNENAKFTVSVPKLSSGQYVNVLTDEEKKFFEDLFGFEPNAMSIYNKRDNYWDDSNKDHVNTVTLTKRSVFLDLSDPNDYIRYKILKANKDFIAPSLEVLKTRPKATYQFVLVEDQEEQKMAKASLNNNMAAFMKLGEIKDDAKKMRFVVENLMNMQLSASNTIEFLQTKAQEYIMKDAAKFLSVTNDPLIDNKILIKEGVASGTVTSRGTYFYLTEGNVPLCGANQEPTLENAAKFLSLPKNQEMKFLIQAKLNQ